MHPLTTALSLRTAAVRKRRALPRLLYQALTHRGGASMCVCACLRRKSRCVHAMPLLLPRHGAAAKQATASERTERARAEAERERTAERRSSGMVFLDKHLYAGTQSFGDESCAYISHLVLQIYLFDRYMCIRY